MSYVNEIIDCVKIQGALNDLWPNPTRILKEEEARPHLAYTLSAQNNTADIAISDGRGKIRTVEVIYEQRMLESEIQENVAHGCSASGVEADKVKQYEMDITRNIGTETVIDPADLVGTCEEDTVYIARKLELHLAAMRDKMASRIAADTVADLGAWASNVDNLNVGGNLVVQAFINNQTYQPNPSLWIDLDEAMLLTNFREAGIFGDQILRRAARAAAVGGVADFGINLQEALSTYGKGVFYDRFMTNALTAAGGGQNSIAQALGAAQVVFWNKYANPALVKNDDSSKAFVINDHVYGYPVDVRLFWDCDVLNVKLIATPKVITLPDDMFKVGDRMAGVNGLAGITVDNCAGPEPCPVEG
jgi:hypothetical protein